MASRPVTGSTITARSPGLRARADYDRTRTQQKKHNEALIALALRRTDVLYASSEQQPDAHPTRRRSLTKVIRAPPPFHGFIPRCLAHEPS